MINTTKIDRVQAKINAALAQIAADEGVVVSFGGIKYNPKMYYTKMTITEKLAPKEAMSANEQLSRSVGFTQNVLGMTFKHKSAILEIIEIKTRSPKYKVIARAKNGARWKFTVSQAKTYLGGDQLINREANLNKLV